MATPLKSLTSLIEQARTLGPIRVAVVDAAQGVVIETLREAYEAGLVEPRLVGTPDAIARVCNELGWQAGKDWIVPTSSDPAAAAQAAELARAGEVDAIMKGNLHTDVLMHALLDNASQAPEGSASQGRAGGIKPPLRTAAGARVLSAARLMILRIRMAC